jgi:hypothetical protein
MLENSGFLDLFDRPHSALPTQLAPQLLETPVVVEMKINFHSYTKKKKKKKLINRTNTGQGECGIET